MRDVAPYNCELVYWGGARGSFGSKKSGNNLYK